MLTLLSPIENFLKKLESLRILFDQRKKKKLSQGTLAYLKGQHVKAIQKWKSGSVHICSLIKVRESYKDTIFFPYNNKQDIFFFFDRMPDKLSVCSDSNRPFNLTFNSSIVRKSRWSCWIDWLGNFEIFKRQKTPLRCCVF